MNDISSIALANQATEIATPESRIKNMIDYIQSFFDKTQPEVTVPIIIVAILVIGFIFGWFRGFFRNIIVIVAIFAGLGVGIFVAPYILHNIVVNLMERVGLDVEKHKPALELGIKLVLPVVMLITSFVGYSVAGTFLTLIRIFRRSKKPKRPFGRRLVMGLINGGLGTIAFIPGSILVANLVNVSSESNNKFTNNLLNPLVKTISLGKGIGIGKNINELKDLFSESDLIYNFFKNPGDISLADRQRIIKKTVAALNNPDLSQTIVSTINGYIKNQVEAADSGEENKTITSSEVEKALQSDLNAVKINNMPMKNYVKELNILGELNENGKKSLNDIIVNSIDSYSDKSVSQAQKDKLAKKAYNDLIDKK